MLKGETQPGVWFPEQREAVPDRRALLQVQPRPKPKPDAGARSHRIHGTGSCEVTWVKGGPAEELPYQLSLHTGCPYVVLHAQHEEMKTSMRSCVAKLCMDADGDGGSTKL